MKTNIIKALLLGGILMGTTSCNDFLDQTSLSEHNEENNFNSPYYTNLVLNKVYGNLTVDGAYAQVMAFSVTANTDCELIDATKVADFTAANERGFANYNASPSSWSKNKDAWDAMYAGIEYCNRIIDGVNNGTTLYETGSNGKLMRQYKSEARTLRAMLYFDLVKNYGDVPFKMEASKNDLSNIYKPKSDRDDIMDSLIVELEEAIPDLPWVGESNYTTEHVTKGYAHALLAQIALQRAGWAIREHAKEGYETATENSDPTYPTQRCGASDHKKFYKIALSHLNEVINSGKHQLNDSFENEWYLVNQRVLDTKYHENLFEVPMGLNKSGERGYTVGVRVAGGTDRYGAKGNSSGKIKTTAPFFMSFQEGDSRRDITCVPYTIAVKKVGKANLTEEKFDSNKPFALYIGKWDVRKMNEEWRQAACASSEKVPTGINEIKMRYPQVLLLYAECLNDLNGNPDDATGGAGLTARQALGMVHERAYSTADKAKAQAYINNLPSDKDGFFKAIVQENAWELCGEGYRKYDLERWNLLSNKIDEAKQTYLNQLNNGLYPEKLFYKTTTDAEGNISIDMKSICWKIEDVPSEADQKDYKSTNWWGYELKLADDKQDNINLILPKLSAGLNTTVKNRYLMPIPSSTIADFGHLIENSYGY